MKQGEPKISVNVDVTNPGQFFACCGLLELADRLWPGADGWFADHEFLIACAGDLPALLTGVVDADLEQIEPDNDTASPIRIGEPFGMTLNWWRDNAAGGKFLKVWAGSMRSTRIARAMKSALSGIPKAESLFDYGTLVYEGDKPTKKVEPFYFDSRRGGNASSRDIGFAPDSLGMTTIAFPAVEFFCLVGLQRFRPQRTGHRRRFVYHRWRFPLPLLLASAAAAGGLPGAVEGAYRFENAFRTDQKKHKAFLAATPIGDNP